jgi:hypothetical protein
MKIVWVKYGIQKQRGFRTDVEPVMSAGYHITPGGRDLSTFYLIC